MKQYTCDICEKVFTKDKLRNHYEHQHNINNSKKVYQCNICTTTFKAQRNFTSHIKIVHKGQKDYKCESCGKSFSESFNLNRHINLVHKGKKD